MSNSVLTSKGRTAIPIDIRNGLGIEPGVQLEFHLRSNGSAIMRIRRGTLNDFIGILRQPGKCALGLKEMDEGIANAVRAKQGGKLSGMPRGKRK